MIANDNLIWIDLEMSGLDPQRHRILEIAMVITDSQLNPLAETASVAIAQPLTVLASMDEWCTRTHTASGLVTRVQQSSLTEPVVEQQLLAWLSIWVPPGVSPMCGNTVGQDRRFLRRYMPQLEAYFHYRAIDVSTLKELARRWRPELFNGWQKESPHQALADIHESIAELSYYRQHWLQPKQDP
ncbi:MAG: oligoribonuclease [Candidatus Symbiodolus clandestinus]